MKIGIFKIFVIAFLVCLLLENVYEPLRYLKYFVPLLAFIPFYGADKTRLNSHQFSYFHALLVFYGIVIGYLLLKGIVTRDLEERFFPNAAFILLPLVLIFFIQPFFDRERVNSYVKICFAFYVGLFFVQQASSFILVISDYRLLKEAIISSTIDTENQLAFTLGFFLFYFIIKRYPTRYVVACGILFILSFKRIALGAFVASYITYVLLSTFKVNVAKRRFLFVMAAIIFNFCFLKLTFLIVDGSLDDLVQQYTNLSTNQFLLGRQVYYQTVLEKVGDLSWSGLGLGKVDAILYGEFFMAQNLHSDILKNYLEFGVVLFVVWIGILVYKSSFSKAGLSIMVYFNVLMLTDNVFIYVDFMFFFYFFILIYISDAYPANQPTINAPPIRHASLEK